MNTIVDRLLEVEQEARGILDGARQYQEMAARETEAEKQRIHALYDEKAQRHIRDVREQCEQEAVEAGLEIQARYSQLTGEMEHSYHQNQEGWLDALVQRVLQEQV